MSQVTTGVPTAPPKNQILKASLKATKARRKQQRCRVFEVKPDSSHLNQLIKTQLKRLFLEAKWLYNHILSQPSVFDIDYKLAEVPVKVDNWFPSTKTCSCCGNIRDIGLDERIYVCPVCRLVMDRDHNSSVTIEHEGLTQLLPTGRRDVKPEETESSTLTSLEYLNGIPYVKARLVGEAGSLTALT